MSEEIEPAVSEQVDESSQEAHQDSQVEPTMVPLSALQAERRKRQEEQQMRQEVTARMAVLEQQIMQQKNAAEPEDPEALITKGDYREEKAQTKRELREEIYQENNPEKVTEVNKYLKQILEKKPWLASSLEDAPNRYSRAHEIVTDYKHLVEDIGVKRVTTNAAVEAKRIVENSKKPGSPVAVGKSAQPDGVAFLKSIQGKKEFREYRQKMLRGES